MSISCFLNSLAAVYIDDVSNHGVKGDVMTFEQTLGPSEGKYHVDVANTAVASVAVKAGAFDRIQL
jgi:hypothetical protein